MPKAKEIGGFGDLNKIMKLIKRIKRHINF